MMNPTPQSTSSNFFPVNMAPWRSRADSQSLSGCQQKYGIVGTSSALREALTRVERVAPYYRSVLITGPTGTGKELFAQAMHKLSPASRGNLVVINCSAVVETLFESELFGHVRGAFTGATCDKVGMFEHAHHGTLFLDEIGDMPLSTQAKLLRVLQNQEVQRLGSLTPRKVDVRIIAATNKDLRHEVAQKSFREDLYYRLCMVEVRTPALVERDGDLSLLMEHFLGKFTSLYGKSIEGLTPEAREALERHDWPGNVRELENAIGHGCMMAQGEWVDLDDLPPYLANTTLQSYCRPTLDNASEGLPMLMEQERNLLHQALTKSEGNQTRAARTLGISRDTLRYRMKKHGLIEQEASSAAA